MDWGKLTEGSTKIPNILLVVFSVVCYRIASWAGTILKAWAIGKLVQSGQLKRESAGPSTATMGNMGRAPERQGSAPAGTAEEDRLILTAPVVSEAHCVQCKEEHRKALAEIHRRFDKHLEEAAKGHGHEHEHGPDAAEISV